MRGFYIETVFDFIKCSEKRGNKNVVHIPQKLPKNLNKTKVDSDQLGRLKYLMRNRSRNFLGGSCVHMYCTPTVTVLYSLHSISDVS